VDTHVDVYYAPRMRVALTLSVVGRSRIYKEVLYMFIRSRRMLCGSTSMSSHGCVVFVPKMGCN